MDIVSESKRPTEGKTEHGGKEATAGPEIGGEEGNAAPLLRLIKQEHEDMRTLFNQYQSVSSKEQKRQICRALIEKLVAHGGREEIALYPAFRDVLPNGDQEAEQAKHEHDKMMADMYKLEQCSWENEAEYDKFWSQLLGVFNEHSSDEEQRLLPLFSRHIQPDAAHKVLDQYQNATVTTRPHPWAPREGMAAAAAHMASKPLDAMRDAMSGEKK